MLNLLPFEQFQCFHRVRICLFSGSETVAHHRHGPRITAHRKGKAESAQKHQNMDFALSLTRTPYVVERFFVSLAVEAVASQARVFAGPLASTKCLNRNVWGQQTRPSCLDQALNTIKSIIVLSRCAAARMVHAANLYRIQWVIIFSACIHPKFSRTWSTCHNRSNACETQNTHGHIVLWIAQKTI